MFDTPPIVFERPRPHGWHTLVFPQVHDQNTIIEVWVDNVFQWMDARNISRNGVFWCLAQEKRKRKKGDAETPGHVSPVFFFKDQWSAIQMKWRFNGESVE